jgi:broad specificity phosphatase PhoE
MQSSAEIIHNYPDLNLSIEPDPRLQDPHSPDLFGKSLLWLAEIVDPYTNLELQNLRIERPPSFTARMMSALKDVLGKHGGKTVFVVSHGDPTAFAMWQLLNPGKPLPSLRELKNEKGRVVYLEKGEAWRILFDDAGNVVEQEHISASKIE